LLNGLNIFQGKVTHQAVAESLDYQYNPVSF
jgi:alanine dehydrogenase